MQTQSFAGLRLARPVQAKVRSSGIGTGVHGTALR